MRARISRWQWMAVVLVAPFCLGASCRQDVQEAAESGALDFVSATTTALLESTLLANGPLAN